MNAVQNCPICSGTTALIGFQKGQLDSTEYGIRHCEDCRFSYVENYRSDFHAIYDENYYRGVGADPLVDYVYEIENFDKTIRNHEWSGIFSIYLKLCPDGGTWLDYGGGGGGLVRFARQRGVDAYGFEEGWIAELGKISGTPILNPSQLEAYEGTFDFISAIEVIEHIPRPVVALQHMRKLLKPGGILFITTGNAQPWRENLLAWPYTKCPEVHVSFFEPTTVDKCMRLAGFAPKYFDSPADFTNIIRFKILKTLRVKNMTWLANIIPWSLVSRLANFRHKVSHQPYGVAE